ncbi:MAG: hypothetical protein NZ520_10295, partial [bacterium]|nr:hypothetical protein [bacterium]
MRAFLRLWAMCLWLALTSPLYWSLTLVCLYAVGVGRPPVWVQVPLFASVAAISLLFSLFVEAGRALGDRVRFARSRRRVLGAAAATSVVSAV